MKHLLNEHLIELASLKRLLKGWLIFIYVSHWLYNEYVVALNSQNRTLIAWPLCQKTTKDCPGRGANLGSFGFHSFHLNIAAALTTELPLGPRNQDER